MKTVKLSKILKDLQADGWYEVSQRGSHRQFKKKKKKGTVTVDGKESKTICGFLLKSLERQSGLKF